MVSIEHFYQVAHQRIQDLNLSETKVCLIQQPTENALPRPLEVYPQ